MIHFFPNCYVMDNVYEICNKHGFDRLDESENGITIEYVGRYKWIDTNEFEKIEDYFNAVAIENRKSIHPDFIECWAELKKLNEKYSIFEKWIWYNDDYITYYLKFTNEFKKKIFGVD